MCGIAGSLAIGREAAPVDLAPLLRMVVADMERDTRGRIEMSLPDAAVMAPIDADAFAVLARLDAEFGEHVFGLHRHHAWLTIGQRLARRLQHRASRAPAADPARDDRAVRTDDRLGARLRRGHRYGAHDRGQRKRLLGGCHLRHQFHHFDMSGHRTLHHSFAR